jgi:hypothetical protein
MATLDDLLAQMGPSGSLALPSQQVAPPTQPPPAPIAPAATVRRGGAGAQTPLLSSNPANVTKLTNKWSELAAIRDQFPEPVWNALIEYDAERVSTGSQPLTREQTVKAAVTARDRSAVTAPPERNPLAVHSNLVGDVGTFVKSLPRLPGALVKEVTDIPRAAQIVGENRAAGQGTLEALANAPGVRLLPGSYIAANLDNPAELLRHPLFTLLDALPYASRAAGATRVGKAAREVTDLAGKRPNPLKAVATRTIDDAGDLVPNRLGRGIDAFASETTVGRGLSTVFGAASREVSRHLEEAGAKLAAVRDDVIPASALDPAAEPFARLMAQSAKLGEKYDFDQARRIDLTRRAQLGDYGSMAPDELAFVNEARQLGESYGKQLVDDDLLGQLDVDGRVEFFPKDVAASVRTAREQTATTRRLATVRPEMLNPSGQLTLDDFDAGLAQAATTHRSIPQLGGIEARAILHTMEMYGYDTKAMRTALRKGKSPADIHAEFQTARAGGAFASPIARMSPLELIAELRKQRNHTQAQVLAAAIADQNTTRITKALDNILAQTRSTPMIAYDPRFADSVRAIRDRQVFDNSTLRVFTDKRAARYEKRAATLLARNPPARFQPLLANEARRRTIDRVMPGGATPDQAAAITQLVTEARWGALEDATGMAGGDALKLYDGIADEVRATWRDLAARGVDPTFVHRVPRSRAQSVVAPRIGPVPGSISQVKDRLADFSPGLDDISVALTHQGMEVLSRQASENAIDFIVRKYGIRESDLRERFADRARAAGEQSAGGFEQGLRDIVEKRFEAFNPDQRGYSWGGAKLDPYRQETWFIPKALADNLHRIASPKGAIASTFDPITKTFRLAVVGLSPRTQLYNILGGATMLLGRTGPSVFKYYDEARKLVRNPGAIDNETLRATIGSSTRDVKGLEYARAESSNRFMLGRTMARLLDESQAGRAVGTAGEAGGKLVNASLKFNAMFDDQYRVMAYLYGYDKAAAKGMAPDVAQRAGEELMRKTMMDWTGMTPIERTVFKSIFPFYGFMSHALRYVAKYPVDHPVRASVVAALGRAEEDDLGALPGSFLGSIALGNVDGSGRQNWLNTAAVNPFADVANMMTFAGFLSATNPALTTVFEQVGLIRGEAELYPTLRYDPQSGRLAAQHGNPLMRFVENTVPQSSLVTSLLGVNGEFNQRMRRDPAGAQRSLMSAAGLPVLWRNYSVPAEVAKAEVARQRSEDTAKTAALESGNWTEALRYPGLRSYFEQIGDLPPEVLDAYRPAERDQLVKQIAVLSQPTSGNNAQRSGGM